MILFLKPHSSFEGAAVLFAFLLKLVFCPASNCLKSNFFQLIPHLLFVNTAFLNVPKISFFWPQDVHVSNVQYVEHKLHISHILPLDLVSTFRNKCELAAYILWFCSKLTLSLGCWVFISMLQSTMKNCQK